jgi:hypothetical protein
MTKDERQAIYQEIEGLSIRLETQAPEMGPRYYVERMQDCRRAQDRVVDLCVRVNREMSRARMDTDRSRTMTRSCRSYCGSLVATFNCGRASARIMAPAHMTAAASVAARVRARVRRDNARNRGATGEARRIRFL